MKESYSKYNIYLFRFKHPMSLPTVWITLLLFCFASGHHWLHLLLIMVILSLFLLLLSTYRCSINSLFPFNFYCNNQSLTLFLIYYVPHLPLIPKSFPLPILIKTCPGRMHCPWLMQSTLRMQSPWLMSSYTYCSLILKKE